jgi:predicted nucleotidyltransferase
MDPSDAISWLHLTSTDLERLRRRVCLALATRGWAEAAWLFGSAARGARARDLDLGLLVERIPTTLELEDLRAEIAADLGWAAEKLDLRVVNRADPVFLGNFLRDGKLLYERDPEARIRFEVWATKQWCDYRPVWERMRSRVLESWSHG